MNQKTLRENPGTDPEILRLRQANAEARTLLADVARKLRAVLDDQYLMESTPIEVCMPIESGIVAIGAALRRLEATGTAKGSASARPKDAPTKQQGQFLAYIREFMLRNTFGIAPTHAELQRFFQLTPPSVNSMLIRLEQRGFIRRTPGVARAIEISIDPGLIPPLDQPFRF